MREPPTGLHDQQLLELVRREWLASAEGLRYLPLGFGAHHWTAHAAGGPALFVTLDRLGGHHDATSLEAAYAAAAELERSGLDFVVPCLPASGGRFTVPLPGGAVSACSWLEAERPPTNAPALDLVRALHAVRPPTGLPRWRGVVDASFGSDLAERLRVSWTAGPLAQPAQEALRRCLPTVTAWSERYRQLCDEAADRPWVTTHGEPHRSNLLEGPDGLRMVDWESVRLAPAERDLRWFDVALDADPGMVELFTIEWTLDEIAQYSVRFEEPHAGTDDDRTALEGLMQALARPSRIEP